ncbi:MAG: methionine ABC transporter substrate-binding protein [Acidaminobacter sp.]|uniref:MetQ/NlpA family ABC transporter substrate-binding protein n=1 Tax=Acidaminobacter sp. TaxID=1872102 RepID=UPI00137E37C5|nr:MetQ/NlpA family ABC transporter substrate-binding protein [Acidaminobacter sp.]MZQ98867.1 methionine ABC transporter substrate-binding protein [Acidaminobacter sp.]
MKKQSLILLLILILSLALFAGCSVNTETTTAETPSAETPTAETTILKVGATPVPHAELLSLVADDLLAQGIELQIVEFTDYVKPNLALNDGELDANFFQHQPYLDGFNAEHQTDVVSAGNVHVEPLALYSEKVNSADALPEGAVIAIPSDAVNGGRALILLEANGLITLSEDSGLDATELDIVENPKNLKFKAIEAAQLPRVLQDVDAAVINGNYAIEAGLNPVADGLLVEGAESPYANILAVRAGEENNEALKALLAALQSEEVKAFIESTYEGSVVVAF